ncbi:MAG TPA: Re/Si-specific NAD(P)(+) transhydrogenase subunit alpha [Ignavibacteria bacterium]|nr:Re/Si-specific NAD(P)(+) transhydrogenase subunit alpha [Ignavibacteria bacterium]
MILSVLKEENDNRVALIPEHVQQFAKLGAELWIENSAGDRAFFFDDDYKNAGALIKSKDEILKSSDIILKVNAPVVDNISSIKQNLIFIGILRPFQNKSLTEFFASKNITSFSLELMPRITRAQIMDVLSSQANIAGYKAVLIAADNLPRYFPMLTTAAGSIPPAKVLIIGAGVAGLQAIATAKRLGAVVEVFDTRSAVEEEVKSLGAKFIKIEGAKEDKAAGGYAVEQSEDFLKRQSEAVHNSAIKSDAVITTAQIPNKKAPILIYKNTIEKMKKGSVIVDLASSTGGNTELTENNKTININGVTIIGNSNLASLVPSDASKLLSKNIFNFMKLFLKDGQINLDFNDVIIQQTCVTANGEVKI